MRNTFVDTVIEFCDVRDDIFIITGDGGFGVLDTFKSIHSNRFLNLGVAEQNMASFAAGLALTGYKVMMYNIIPFVLYRCYEQIRNDICYQRLPVVLAGIGSGVTYAPAGMTHYSVEDIGIARTLPNLTVISPIDPIEAKLAAQYAIEADKPVYVRLAKRGEPNIHSDERCDITSPCQLTNGKDVAIVFHGSIGVEVLKAREILCKYGIEPKLISVPMLQPFNMDQLLPLLNGVRYLVSVEEHYVNSGLGSLLAGEYAKGSFEWKLVTLGIDDRFIHEIKDAEGMREYYGISGKKIAGHTKAIMK